MPRTTNNKRSGTAFEKRMLQLLSAHGFWAHKLVENENGAPFDLLAIKEGACYAIECKELNGFRFPLSRVEDNQITGLRTAAKHGITPLFLFQTNARIHVAPAQDILLLLDAGIEKSVRVTVFEDLEDWLHAHENYC